MQLNIKERANLFISSMQNGGLEDMMQSDPLLTCALLALDIRYTCNFLAPADSGGTRWKCSFSSPYGTTSTPFFQGSAYKQNPPNPWGVLNSLMLDSQVAMRSFDDFISEFGYDRYNEIQFKSAKETYAGTQKSLKALQKILGTLFNPITHGSQEQTFEILHSMFKNPRTRKSSKQSIQYFDELDIRFLQSDLSVFQQFSKLSGDEIKAKRLLYKEEGFSALAQGLDLSPPIDAFDSFLESIHLREQIQHLPAFEKPKQFL